MAESNTKKNSTQKLPLSVFYTVGGSFIGEVFGQDVSVAPFEFPYQSAFRAVSATEQRAGAYIVREDSQEQSILAETAEEDITAEQVGTQERVCLPFGHIRRQPLSFQQAMTITDIRMPITPMPALKVFHAAYGTLEA